MEKLKYIIAKNLIELRKKNRLTQLELAEKLNYSDKAVSKWEQGESVPGIEVLYKLSKLYNVSLDFIVGEYTARPEKITTAQMRKKRCIITLLSVLAVWLVATLFYIAFDIFAGKEIWMIFCWAVPASFIVSIIFDVIWHNKRFLFTMISLLLWTVLLCFCLQFLKYGIWKILGIGIPLQASTLLWAKLVEKSKTN